MFEIPSHQSSPCPFGRLGLRPKELFTGLYMRIAFQGFNESGAQGKQNQIQYIQYTLISSDANFFHDLFLVMWLLGLAMDKLTNGNHQVHNPQCFGGFPWFALQVCFKEKNSRFPSILEASEPRTKPCCCCNLSASASGEVPDRESSLSSHGWLPICWYMRNHMIQTHKMIGGGTK